MAVKELKVGQHDYPTGYWAHLEMLDNGDTLQLMDAIGPSLLGKPSRGQVLAKCGHQVAPSSNLTSGFQLIQQS